MIARPFFHRCLVLLGCLVVFCSLASSQSAPVSTIAFATVSASPNPAAASDSQPPTDFVFQKRVDEVNLLFTVVDRKGRFRSDLKLDDLELLDNNLPPEKVHIFQRESDLPLRVALVVDMSGSVTARFKYEQWSAIEFFKKILRPSMDKAMVLGFNEKLHLEQDLTNNVDALRGAVLRLKPSGETSIFDALVFAANKLNKESEKGTRKIIILISDGENNGSRALMNDAEQAALRAECPIFSLSTNQLQGGEYTKGESVLELLSRYTGGELLKASSKSEVSHAFKLVEEALRSQYMLSYKPADFTTDGRYRPVALTAHDHKLRVECRRGYFAPRE